MIAHNITDYSQQKPKRPAVQIAQTARMTSKRRNNSTSIKTEWKPIRPDVTVTP